MFSQCFLSTLVLVSSPQSVLCLCYIIFFPRHQVLKHEVELISKMAKTIDGFTQNQTRMAIIIDGLDACEQDKVLQMLDTVRLPETLEC